MIYKDFYSELGKLLYAVADVDGVITQQEKKALQEIIKRDLVPAETHLDAFGTDTAYYTEIEFDILDEQIGDTEAAFNSFFDYVEEHHTAFDDRMKKIILYLVAEIASAYHGTNKKEKALIDKLAKKLKKIEFGKR